MTRMIDVSKKIHLRRTAVAEGTLKLKASTVRKIREGKIKKGDVLAASQIAGIQGAKGTSGIIPLCHLVPLLFVEVRFSLGKDSVTARTKVISNGVTGVEMEALVGTSVALLNVWDMVKYLEKDKDGQYPVAEVSGIRVLRKTKEEI